MDRSEPITAKDASAGDGSPDLELIFAPVTFVNHGFVAGPPGHDVCTLVGRLPFVCIRFIEA
jgi:choline dehydrogenase